MVWCRFKVNLQERFWRRFGAGRFGRVQRLLNDLFVFWVVGHHPVFNFGRPNERQDGKLLKVENKERNTGQEGEIRPVEDNDGKLAGHSEVMPWWGRQERRDTFRGRITEGFPFCFTVKLGDYCDRMGTFPNECRSHFICINISNMQLPLRWGRVDEITFSDEIPLHMVL